MAEGLLRAMAGDRFEAERLAAFRRIRDEVHARLTAWLAGSPP